MPTLKITGIYKGRRDALLCGHLRGSMYTNPCNFATFQTTIKSLLFGLRDYEFSILPNVLPLFLYLIINCQQRLATGKLFGARGQRFLAFKSNQNHFNRIILERLFRPYLQ